MAAIDYTISLLKPVEDDNSNVLVAFKGEGYDHFTHSFKSGKLFLRRNVKAFNSENNSDIICLVNDGGINIDFDKGLINHHLCKNVAITFKLDGMYMSEQQIRDIGKRCYTQFLTYENIEVIRRDFLFIKRYSNNFMFVLESNASVKQVPLLISIYYELD